ncbi:MAG: hypothetical protein COU90_01725 [Candidatus Ryanbacteria bacterium CG10_big_fil_rev_8_21_14_0_10_43_42]|uniref:Uncharacterized protein n=1 Tax=Candidatus Ryanbacteria bacterium CG10_big_fil_rev_8_21_14_0_10_43_42 TaxID=1974864 RepID=A0A2M8KX84_9BACT|nr:MAG: hypothetical protein COU90_01725 [Candidatus Ryanbacteria bacterium CG10_big_fil_rev_8_21_14_0_10_43_42]
MKTVSPISKYLLLFAVLAFFLVSFFGLGHTNMATGPDGQMSSSNCFMPGMTASLCQMNPFEHIATWQSMFTAIPSQSDFVLLLFALLALSAFFIRSYQSMAPPQALVLLQPVFAYYKRRMPIMHSLQEAFSNGILHPKIF